MQQSFSAKNIYKMSMSYLPGIVDSSSLQLSAYCTMQQETPAQEQNKPTMLYTFPAY